jgi:hypothetical protein
MKLVQATHSDIRKGSDIYDVHGRRIEIISDTANVARNNRRYRYVVEIHYDRYNVQLRSFEDLSSFYVEVQRKFVNVYWKDNQLSKGNSTYPTAKKAEEFGKAGKKGKHWIKAVEVK